MSSAGCVSGLAYYAMTEVVTNRGFTIFGMPSQFIAWSPGIAKGQTCNACYHNWQLTSAMFMSPPHSVTLP
jgi:glutathione peroxidase-family protein